jgi:hypothetical protein
LLKEKVDNNVDFLVTPTPFSESGSIVDVFITGAIDSITLIKISHSLAEYIMDCFKDWSFDSELIEYSANIPLQELYVRIMKFFINPSLSLRFATGTSPRDFNVDIIMEKENRRKWNRNFSQYIKDGKFAREREWELSMLHKLVAKQKDNVILIAISNIHLYNPDGTRQVEWDGAFFKLNDSKLTLYLIEAKTGVSKNSKKCRTALLDSIEKAGIKLKKSGPKVINGNGYAYTAIDIQNIVLNDN